MKRSRRDRALGLGAFLVVYSVLQAVSSARGGLTTTPGTAADREKNNPSPSTTQTSLSGEDEDDMKDETTTSMLDFKSSTQTTTGKTHHEAVAPTWRPKRQNCTPPAIEQFPQPLMGKYARRHGGLIIHVLVAIFTFMGLAIVCDDYFVSSLDRICEELKMSPDVAGATFMAAGSSAPELATVIIGVFFAKDDIGVSGVIGSAVFNIMFVISVCALCAGTVSHLNWWPLCRDSFFYAVSILVMLATICDDVIKWPEAAFMLMMYVVYCVALHFNPALERWAMSLNLPFKLPTREEQAALVTYKTISSDKTAAGAKEAQDGSNYTEVEGGNVATTTNVGANHPQQGYMNNGYENAGYNADLNQTWDPNQSWGENTQPAEAPVWDPASSWDENPSSASTQQTTNYSQWGQPAAVTSPGTISTAPSQPVKEAQAGKGQQQLTIQAAAGDQNYYRPKEYNPDNIVNPLDKPANAGVFSLGLWYVVYPIHFTCRLTMPDCRSEKYRNWYPFTFFVSMIWISFYSYFMVWMITVIGSTLGIPDTVMGLTFVAAGVSVPDALSSLAVIKEGYGDMAVSNAVGSNVFDILICLGLPWFIQTAIIKPGSHVNVISKGLTYSTLSLLSTVIFLVLATHLNGWKLDRKYGIILMVWYLLFITFASLYELNVFGELNPPECASNF